jgi:hypothetical protein
MLRPKKISRAIDKIIFQDEKLPMIETEVAAISDTCSVRATSQVLFG